MQLGTRWPFGSTPPASVPAETRARVAALEATRADGAGRTWTLTWLEGRAIVELDDGTVIDGDTLRDAAALGDPDDGDDW
ncbi:hypothetical protein ROT00_02710 [Agromyces mediolanus]|uniref:hypothetical protein n=1 Tax=Agromyces mediolanus TaxID=41986 RepID=UPI0038327F7A